MKCPLIQPNGDCVKNLCAWWMAFSEACAVHTLAEFAQDELADKEEARGLCYDPKLGEYVKKGSLKIPEPEVHKVSLI